MSGFAAYLSFAEPPTDECIAAIAGAIAYRGRDAQATLVVGPCTMMHTALWTTEAEQERQPQRHVVRDVWLVADARIDNRADLVGQLRGRVRQPLATDADLILAGYERWGADCVARLIGDFGFAIWDGERDELVVARDHLGIRPVFYAPIGDGVVVGSTLTSVLAGLDESPSIDEEYLAGYLTFTTAPDRSLWDGVHRLAPAHVLRVRRGARNTRRYWNPSLEPLKQNVDETIQQVTAAFDEAVRCRLRSRDRVACGLSGGLDSSTITATAAGMGADVQAIGLAFRAHPEADETEHQLEMARFLDIPLEVIEADALAVLDPYQYTRLHGEPLYAVDATDTAACLDAARAHGCSVFLSGVGGDEAFYGETMGAVDLMGRGHLLEAMRWAMHDGRTRSGATKWLLGNTGRNAARALARRALRSSPHGPLARGLITLRDRRAQEARPWFRTAPAESWTARSRGVARSAAARLGYYVDSPFHPLVYELTDRLAVERGLEVRYPFLDLRLVELMIRLPEGQIRLGGSYRGLHRAAFGARLPSRVALRSDKADLSRPYMRKALAAVNSDQASAAIGALGDRVDHTLLLDTYDEGYDAFRTRHGHPRGFDLWAAVSAGLALATMSQKQAIPPQFGHNC